MTTPDPARWQPDPTGRHHERFHNGVTGWTGHVRDAAGYVTTSPMPAHVARGPRALPQLRRYEDLPWDHRQTLAELEITSCGTTSSPGGGVGGGGEPNHEPTTGDRNPPHVRHRENMLTCREEDLPAMLVQARKDLTSLTRRAAPPLVDFDLRKHVLNDCVGDPPAVLAASRFHLAERTTRKWRTDDGRDPETGKKLPGRGDTAAEKVAVLADQGKSVRVIAMTVGLPKSTVHDMLVALVRAA